jgi:hypothetical protein
MHDAFVTHIENPGPVALAARWKMAFVAGLGVGVLAFAGGLLTNPDRAWHNYLTCYFFFTCMGVFGLFYTAMHHAVNATWMLVTRRLAEGLAAFIPVALILFIGLIVGRTHIWPWATGFDLGDVGKARWLSAAWFFPRNLLILAVWVLFAWKIVGFSLEQDRTGDRMLSRRAINWSLGFMPIFAGTFALFSIDLLMSIAPTWYSTMFSVYCFAGMFQSGLALLTILFILFKRQGALAPVATPSHLKDLGTLVFAFTIFMTYIGFAQYLLIWYANLPDETSYFLLRQHGGWQFLFLTLPLLKFAVPFFGLLSQGLKKSDNWLMSVCMLTILGQFFDCYWMVMPSLSKHFVAFGWMEIGIFLGFAGLFGLTVSRFYSRYPVLAARDPRILQSVNWRFWE